MNEIATSPASTAAQALRRAVVGTVVVLVALVVWWSLASGVSIARVVLAVVATLPLWLTVPQLMARNRRAYAWMTLAVIPYLVLAITEAVANPSARLWAGACLFTGFALFAMLIAYLRVTRVA